MEALWLEESDCLTLFDNIVELMNVDRGRDHDCKILVVILTIDFFPDLNHVLTCRRPIVLTTNSKWTGYGSPTKVMAMAMAINVRPMIVPSLYRINSTHTDHMATVST
jgi:hypothetical protein